MKYTKLITGLTALATTAMLFTGCGSAAEIKVSLEVVGTEPVTNITTLEPIPTTEPIESQFESQFEFGQKLWIVETENDRAWLGLYAFVGQKDEEFVEAVPYCTSDAEQLREVLSYDPYIYLLDVDCIYEDEYDAKVAVAEANGETFEEYWSGTYGYESACGN